MQHSLCADSSGMDTVVDANKVCGYSELAVSSLSIWRFYLDQLAVVSCSQVLFSFMGILEAHGAMLEA